MPHHPVIDVDGHINGPVDLWDRSVDPPYRDVAPRWRECGADAETARRLVASGRA